MSKISSVLALFKNGGMGHLNLKLRERASHWHGGHGRDLKR